MRILHISDLHIGSGAHELDRAGELVDIITRRYADGEKPVVVITGDVVNDGREEQFITAARILEQLEEEGFDVHPVPGNHDYGWDGMHAEAKRFGLFKKHLIGWRRVTYPDVIEYGDCLLIMLNSMKAEAGFWDGLLADGELGTRQTNELGDILQLAQESRRNGQRVVACLHHHPFLFPDDNVFESAREMVSHWLKDGDALMRTIRGRVDVLLFGHEHRHIDFHEKWPDFYGTLGIPCVLSCGSTTKGSARFESWLIEVGPGVVRWNNPELYPPARVG
ncbi:MAG: metallophosphoesterase [Pseudomonadota bacterium]